MQRGISLHFAVPSPGPTCCTTRTLHGSVGNARELAQLAHNAGLWVREPLIGPAVTRRAVLGALAGAACELATNDLLLVTFSGHGCQRLNVSGHPELDGYDESWCLADGELIDDDLHAAWAQFAPGVRILIISESCHSGILEVTDARLNLRPARPEELIAWEEYRKRVIHNRLDMWNLTEAHADLVLPRRADRALIQANVLLFAACRDREKAKDLHPTSLFTSQLLQVWRGFPHNGTHEQFIDSVRDEVAQQNPEQHPGIVVLGDADGTFRAQRPFTI